jgi:predicted NUDIX family NTP pyrophosphohydrolase
MKTSAGTLLFRRSPSGLEVLIVQPSGLAAKYGWSVPKGLPDPGEPLEAAARRETLEETGVTPGALAELGHIDYVKSRKRVHVFYGEAPQGAEPRQTSWEIAEARFAAVAEARALLHVDQRPLIDMLLARVAL